MKPFLIVILPFIFGFHLLVFSEAQKASAHEQKKLETIYLLNNQKCSPCVLVVFGATGDLTNRKLLPAIYNLAYEGHLSENIAVVGFARAENTHESFRRKMEEAIHQFSRTKPKDPTFWNQFKNHIFYHRAELENDQGYEKLKEFLARIDQEMGTKGNRIYYLATPPSYFPIIIANLKKHQLIYEAENQNHPWSRVMIEKPFGYDLDSAIQLEEQIAQFLVESQIYRIDHYLGKEGVQNVLALRFENELFEPLWSHEHIDNIQITLAEDIGIGSRARLWEETGALRDTLQNHLMQLLAIIAMEPPVDLSAKNIHQEKIRVLEAIRPFPLLEMENYVVRGQYGPGTIQGSKVLGYREEKGVSATSLIETFFAVKLFIDNERWKGVPFYIRGGKRLAKQTTEIAITFKKSYLSQSQNPNVLFIRIQPNAGIFLKTLSKVPALHDCLKPVVFGYKPDAVFKVSSPEAYERIIFDCIRGNDNLFVKTEEQIAAWRLLTPVLDHWKTHIDQDFPNYEAGTWGPKDADQMLLNHGQQWQLLEE